MNRCAEVAARRLRGDRADARRARTRCARFSARPGRRRHRRIRRSASPIGSAQRSTARDVPVSASGVSRRATPWRNKAYLVGRAGLEPDGTTSSNVADRRVKAAAETTNDDVTRREVSASASSQVDAVDGALAEALRAATNAGRWDVVAQLARELEARRSVRAGNVVALDAGAWKRQRAR